MKDGLDEITEEMALNSDEGGDSDAGDDLPETYFSSHSNKTIRTSFGQSYSQFISKVTPEIVDCMTNSDNSNFMSEEERAECEDITLESTISNSGKSGRAPEKQYVWTQETHQPYLFSASQFCEDVEVKINTNTDRLSTFYELLPTAFLNTIVRETNLYTAQHLKTEVFDTVTLEEINAFLGIIIFMGFHQLPSMKLYWSQDENFYTERIARIMPIKRFLFLLRNLHLNDNSKMPAQGTQGFDKLYKVRPMIELLKNTFPKAYAPSRNISIDESMIAFKGRSSIKQYRPMKPIKRGFKVWACCCAEKGYLLNFDVYTGKSSNSGFRLWLLSAQSGDVGIMKWKDRGTKSVSVISTIHDPSKNMTVLRRDNRGDRLPVSCPEAVAMYNRNMCGVDLDLSSVIDLVIDGSLLTSFTSEVH